MLSLFEFLGRAAAECEIAAIRYPQERALFSRFAAESREAQLRYLEAHASARLTRQQREDEEQALYLANYRPGQHNPLRWLWRKLFDNAR